MPAPTPAKPAAAPAKPAAAPAKPAAAPAKPAAAAAMPPITYTVKTGDNLSAIAWWFHFHGYGSIYDANKAVIGDNPNLIFAGQQITISGGTLSVHS